MTAHPHAPGATILVLGAQGLLGRFTARALADAGFRVLRAGRRFEDAPDFRLIDLDQAEALRATLSEADLVVSAIEDPLARSELAVLRTGGRLLSLASVSAAAERLLTAGAGAARGSVVLNAGFTGVVALAVADMLERHPDADGVDLAYMVSVSGSAGRAGVEYIHRVLATGPRPPVVVRRFTRPFGVKRCLDVSAADEIWLSPRVTGNRRLTASVAVAERLAGALLRLASRQGWLAKAPRSLLTRLVAFRRPPKSLTLEPMRAIATVARRGQVLAVHAIEARGDYASTVRSTVRFAAGMLRREVPNGLARVEDLFRLGELRAEFESDDILIRSLEPSDQPPRTAGSMNV